MGVLSARYISRAQASSLPSALWDWDGGDLLTVIVRTKAHPYYLVQYLRTWYAAQ